MDTTILSALCMVLLVTCFLLLYLLHRYRAAPPKVTEADIERAFWDFDVERKRTGAERDAFKSQVRALLTPALVLWLLLFAACTPAALVLQRETLSYYHRARAAEQRVLTEIERQQLGLCLRGVRSAERLAHAGYPAVTPEARAAAAVMRQDCGLVDTWGRGPAEDLAAHRDLKPDNDMTAPVDLGAGG